MVTFVGLVDRLLTLYLGLMFGFLALVTAAAWFGGLRRRRGLRGAPGGPLPRFVVVIPAHDEEANVGATVASCRALAYDPAAFTVFVIADNCTDATARAARAAGAEVFERVDPDRRSKGYALEDFFRHLAGAGPGRSEFDAAVVIDADTVVDPGLLARFADALAVGADWAQCYYTVSNPDASWRTRLLTYALSLFNGVWLLGQDRLGLSVGFRGNGMCLSRRGLGRVPWQAHGLVEDQEFAWQLRVAGERVRFVPEARVYAEMVSRGRAAVSQRRRWEEGRRSLRGRFLRPLLASPALTPWNKALLLLDLLFPPLMPLFGLLLLAAAVHPAALAAPALEPLSRQLLPAHGLMALIVAAYAVSPFLTLGLPLRYAPALLAVPYFAVWKFLATFNARTLDWVRTQRESAAGHGHEP
jgi:cellulose synthase/poly-beta-1,6-N-acetylglucosamine synthase-like glycosyltransferase